MSDYGEILDFWGRGKGWQQSGHPVVEASINFEPCKYGKGDAKMVRVDKHT